MMSFFRHANFFFMFECSDAKKKREYKSETMKWQAKFVFGWTVVLHCLWMSCEASTKQSERSALILFYNATNGPHWKNTPWPITDSGADYCSGWNGVRCNAQGRLQRLSLGYEDLIGAFPNEAFAEFEQLEELDLAGNKLSGTVSSNLCASGAYLRKLNLNHNLLVGPLPSCVSSWTSLTEFKVTGNSFSGSLDSKWGSSWQSLREFSIDSNSFSGTLPESFSHWTNLTTFVIELNDLTGTVPDAYGRSWTQVTVVSLSWNYLTGTLPPSFSNAKNMKEFVFYRNNFVSTLPPEYGSWGSTMIHFEGSNNPNLHGSLPTSYGAWIRMEVFKFTECALTGSIPPEYHTWHNVANFSVWKNNINGTLPSAFSNWKNISDFDASDNIIEGSLPPEWAAWGIRNGDAAPQFLKSFSVANNRLTGTLPAAYSAWGAEQNRINFANFTRNTLSGSLPVEWMQWGSSITFFYAGENSLVGTIPSEWGSLWTKLRAFYASNNSLEGTLPSTWSPTLERLRLFGNKLQGSLPLRWAQLTRLAVLFLHDNQISGTLPSVYQRLQTLQYVTLASNQLSGTFPISWCNNGGMHFILLSLQNNTHLTSGAVGRNKSCLLLFQPLPGAPDVNGFELNISLPPIMSVCGTSMFGLGAMLTFGIPWYSLFFNQSGGQFPCFTNDATFDFSATDVFSVFSSVSWVSALEPPPPQNPLYLPNTTNIVRETIASTTVTAVAVADPVAIAAVLGLVAGDVDGSAQGLVVVLMSPCACANADGGQPALLPQSSSFVLAPLTPLLGVGASSSAPWAAIVGNMLLVLVVIIAQCTGVIFMWQYQLRKERVATPTSNQTTTTTTNATSWSAMLSLSSPVTTSLANSQQQRSGLLGSPELLPLTNSSVCVSTDAPPQPVPSSLYALVRASQRVWSDYGAALRFPNVSVQVFLLVVPGTVRAVTTTLAVFIGDDSASDAGGIGVAVLGCLFIVGGVCVLEFVVMRRLVLSRKHGLVFRPFKPNSRHPYVPSFPRGVAAVCLSREGEWLPLDRRNSFGKLVAAFRKGAASRVCWLVALSVSVLFVGLQSVSAHSSWTCDVLQGLGIAIAVAATISYGALRPHRTVLVSLIAAAGCFHTAIMVLLALLCRRKAWGIVAEDLITAGSAGSFVLMIGRCIVLCIPFIERRFRSPATVRDTLRVHCVPPGQLLGDKGLLPCPQQHITERSWDSDGANANLSLAALSSSVVLSSLQGGISIRCDNSRLQPSQSAALLSLLQHICSYRRISPMNRNTRPAETVEIFRTFQ